MPNEKEIADAVQVFCPICARGVLIRNESMYKCPRCERVVCRPCFDKEHRLCVDCCDPQSKGRQRAGSPIPALADPVVPRPSRDRTKKGFWLFAGGIVIIVAAMVLSLLISIPNWMMTVVAGVACVLFVLGLTHLLRN